MVTTIKSSAVDHAEIDWNGDVTIEAIYWTEDSFDFTARSFTLEELEALVAEARAFRDENSQTDR
jgi:hypothetical protein